MRLPYFPGCTLREKARGFDASARAGMALVGVELVELSQWNCCGAVFPLVVDNLLDLAATVRVLAQARLEAEQLAVACSACYNVLKRVNLVLRLDEDKRDKVNHFIERDYCGDIQVLHLLEILRDGVGFSVVQRAVRKPMAGLKVACYYGCTLLRPGAEMALDDVENPRIMEDLIRALGADPVWFPHRTECCGSYVAVKSADAVMETSHRILAAAGAAGADVIVTSCPLCQFNLDRQQARMGQVHGGFRTIPVIYFAQLMAIALGGDPKAYDLEGLVQDVRPLLQSRGML